MSQTNQCASRTMHTFHVFLSIFKQYWPRALSLDTRVPRRSFFSVTHSRWVESSGPLIRLLAILQWDYFSFWAMQPPPRALFPRNAKKKGTERENKKKSPRKWLLCGAIHFNFGFICSSNWNHLFPLSKTLDPRELTPSLHGWQTRHTLKGTFHPHSDCLSSSWRFS